MENRLVLMKNLFIIIIGVLFYIFNAGCAYSFIEYDGTYKGKVIDADTREPIEGVVVLGTWYREYPTAAGAVHKFYDAKETVTDKNGEFEIPGVGLVLRMWPLPGIEPMYVMIFKAGYEYDSGTWRGLKSRGWKGEYEESYDPVLKTKVKKPIFDPKRKVKWEGKKAIIPLRKLTMEERRRRIPSPDVPTEAPLKKVRLMLKEINKEDVELGLEAIDIWRGEKIE